MRPVPRVIREGPYRLVGLLWINKGLAGWERWLMRKCTRSGNMEMQRLVHVNPAFAFCMHCLSNEVFENQTDGWLECYACDSAFFFLDE